MIRRLIAIGILLLTGCQSNFVGPARRSLTTESIDDPSLRSADEKMRRARDQLAFPDGSLSVGPRTGAEIPNATGR